MRQTQFLRSHLFRDTQLPTAVMPM